MPAPALDRLRQTADRILKVAGPPARSARDRVVREVGRRVGPRLGRRGPDDAPKRTTDRPAERPAARTEPPGTPTTGAGPSPASIAKNVAHERPRAKPPTAARRDPESVPGGKLPPRRPRPA